jgi:hypothetical protein
MSRSTKTGKIKAVVRTREKVTPSRKAEPEIEKRPRKDLLEKYGLDEDDFKDFTNIEFMDLLYCLDIYGVKETLDNLKSKEEDKEKGVTVYTGPQFPFSKLLESKRNEYEYLVNFNPKASIGLTNCRLINCRAVKSVSFLSSITTRGDEMSRILYRCNVCGQIQ